MRTAYAQDAELMLRPGADDRAPGAAITVALCGHWEHQPPCPLAAHHTATDRAGEVLRLRVLFAAEPADEAEVRGRIEAALRAGRDWTLTSTAAGSVRATELAHARRLASG